MNKATSLIRQSEGLWQSIYGCNRVALVCKQGQWVLFAERAPGSASPSLLELLGSRKRQPVPLLLPQRCVVVDQLPMLPDGSVDVERLSNVADSEPSSSEAPRGVVEQLLSALWMELRPGHTIGRSDQLFSAGTDALIAAKLAARIREVFEVEITPQELIETQTPQAQARLIERYMEGA